MQSPANGEAVRVLGCVAGLAGPCAGLVGPMGSGKSHLARAWAQAVGAARFERGSDLAALEGRPVLFEDVDRHMNDEALFHLFNMAGMPGGGLLMTARRLPAQWKADLPDLRSRLNGLTVAQIGAPDDALLRGVLEKFFRERNIRPADDVYEYLLRRIERSIPAARKVVRQLDEAADQQRRGVSRVLAREVLEDSLELFE